MPRISFAWAVITQSHQIKNVCGEFPKAVSSPCLVTSFSLNLEQQKSAQSALGQSGNHLINANFDVLFVSPGISQSAWHQWVAETMLPALRDCWEGQLSICLHFSPLATVLFPYLNPFQCSNLSNPFHLFQFKLQIFYTFHLSHKILMSAIQLRSSRRKLSHPTTRLRLCSPLARNWMKRLLSQRPCHRSHGWHPTIPRHIPKRGQAKFRWQHLARISWLEDTLSRFVVGSCCDNQPKIFGLHRFH